MSLHAPDDELRDELVPVNRRWKVAEVLDAAWEYAGATGRRVSIEYAMIGDVNDQPWRADGAGAPAGRPAGPRQPDPAQPHAGLAVDRLHAGRDPGRSRPALEARRVPVTVRDTRGREIDGACGQLAANNQLAAGCQTQMAAVLTLAPPAGPANRCLATDRR